MKMILIAAATMATLLVGCDRGRGVKMPSTPDSTTVGEPVPMPVPGDLTQDHWAPPTSGKSEGQLPDPLTGTPNQDPNP